MILFASPFSVFQNFVYPRWLCVQWDTTKENSTYLMLYPVESSAMLFCNEALKIPFNVYVLRSSRSVTVFYSCSLIYRIFFFNDTFLTGNCKMLARKKWNKTKQNKKKNEFTTSCEVIPLALKRISNILSENKADWAYLGVYPLKVEWSSFVGEQNALSFMFLKKEHFRLKLWSWLIL